MIRKYSVSLFSVFLKTVQFFVENYPCSIRNHDSNAQPSLVTRPELPPLQVPSCLDVAKLFLKAFICKFNFMKAKVFLLFFYNFFYRNTFPYPWQSFMLYFSFWHFIFHFRCRRCSLVPQSLLQGHPRLSVTSKKSPNVYKCCPKMIALEKIKILTKIA